jgi:hypothetical protein
MPAIPIYERQVGFGLPALPRAQGLPVAGLDLSPLADALDGIAQLEGRLQRHAQAQKVTGAVTAATLRLKTTSFELEGDQDYATHGARLDTARAEIEQEVERQLGDPLLFQAFKTDFDPVALSEGFEVRRRAVRGQQASQAAALEQELEQLADLHAAGDPVQRAQLRTAGTLAIEQALAAGAIAPVDAVRRRQQFQSDLVTAQVRRDLYADAPGTERRLLAGDYADLEPEARVQWLERATARAEAADNRRLAEQDRALRLADRALRQRQEALQKEGDRLLAEGRLDPSWLEAHRDELDAQDYRFWYGKLAEPLPERTDREAYASLRARLAAGEDVSEEARQLYRQGIISQADYDRIESAARSLREGGGLPPWFGRAAATIRMRAGYSELNPTPAAGDVYVNALQDLEEWARANPRAGDREAMDQADAIAQRYRIIQSQQVRLTLRAPRYLVGTLAEPDLAATEQALDAAIAAGAVDAALLRDETLRIERLRELLEKERLGAPGGGSE